ncbi:MAG: GNAT family N-acetyltransferase [Chloroflexi bacterium]|nr:GNAT family N-acetyltransferase [Chloroflexota bacterium]
MDVRQAEPGDLPYCAALSASVQSTHVWQLRLGYDPIAPQTPSELGGMLHCTRLPRPIVMQPASAEPIEQLWHRAAEVLIVEEQDELLGYVALTISETAGAATVARLVVEPQMRRKGIGGALLRAAGQWSRAVGIETLAAHCAARNHPGANFYLRWGMRFAGYSEAFYPRGEIALFFQRPL